MYLYSFLWHVAHAVACHIQVDVGFILVICSYLEGLRGALGCYWALLGGTWSIQVRFLTYVLFHLGVICAILGHWECFC